MAYAVEMLRCVVKVVNEAEALVFLPPLNWGKSIIFIVEPVSVYIIKTLHPQNSPQLCLKEIVGTRLLLTSLPMILSWSHTTSK